MSNTTHTADGHVVAYRGDGTFMGGLLAISRVEREFIVGNPKLRAELRFQSLALVLGPLAMGIAVYRVAISLLGYPPMSAAGVAVAAATALFSLDRHYLIQARGNTSDGVRRAMYKVRAISVLIIFLAFALMVTDTFRSDIEGVLATQRQERRSELEKSPRYQVEIDAARAAMAQASEAGERADALRLRVSQLQVERGRALQNARDEIEGNTGGGVTRVPGPGPKSRGYESAAEQLAREVEVVRQELIALGDVAERLAAAKARLAAVDAQIDAQTSVAFGGKTQRLDALLPLLQNSLSAWVAIGFWLLVGALPDLLMLAAQRPMFNQATFAAILAAEEEDLAAEVAFMRRQLRERRTAGIEPMEVRIAAVATVTDTAGQAQSGPVDAGTARDQAKESAGGRS